MGSMVWYVMGNSGMPFAVSVDGSRLLLPNIQVLRPLTQFVRLIPRRFELSRTWATIPRRTCYDRERPTTIFGSNHVQGTSTTLRKLDQAKNTNCQHAMASRPRRALFRNPLPSNDVPPPLTRPLLPPENAAAAAHDITVCCEVGSRQARGSRVTTRPTTLILLLPSRE